MPELSLIVPHHNHLQCLPHLLDSVLAQDFKDIEVVLVDDCSDEPCLPLVEAYRTKGLNITGSSTLAVEFTPPRVG
ncbi:glycosyltransferase [Desulfovibrio desulfuricans]|uniref:glycosyltransferase family 2 protein n=1 Tax=Desulfovibrio desulfuricans TaxID=876 RepID=UPI001D080A2F|nr:glycosyltransferase [Desulfovibrio desulfuricans]MCB6554689.1 glycosyltransferase [Desulfovibrio desulfuricans]MCB6566537.1 glycosyltransferase [Desulfovibrio desulfuricans]MCB7347712.1 glycosyltransferase [Desulfovibrio desulfuricans]